MLALSLAPAAAVASASGSSSGGGTQFVTSAVEHPGNTVTLPLHQGTSHGQTVYYVILDTSNGNLSSALGVNRSQKLANAAGTAAVEKVSMNNGVVSFPATVDFSPQRVLQAPSGFPPTTFEPGAVGERATPR